MDGCVKGSYDLAHRADLRYGRLHIQTGLSCPALIFRHLRADERVSSSTGRVRP